jgi:hypothetical protein
MAQIELQRKWRSLKCNRYKMKTQIRKISGGRETKRERGAMMEGRVLHSG